MEFFFFFFLSFVWLLLLLLCGTRRPARGRTASLSLSLCVFCWVEPLSFYLWSDIWTWAACLLTLCRYGMVRFGLGTEELALTLDWHLHRHWWRPWELEYAGEFSRCCIGGLGRFGSTVDNNGIFARWGVETSSFAFYFVTNS